MAVRKAAWVAATAVLVVLPNTVHADSGQVFEIGVIDDGPRIRKLYATVDAHNTGGFTEITKQLCPLGLTRVGTTITTSIYYECDTQFLGETPFVKLVMLTAGQQLASCSGADRCPAGVFIVRITGGWQGAVVVKALAEDGAVLAEQSIALPAGPYGYLTGSVRTSYQTTYRLRVEVRDALGVLQDGGERTITIVPTPPSSAWVSAAEYRVLWNSHFYAAMLNVNPPNYGCFYTTAADGKQPARSYNPINPELVSTSYSNKGAYSAAPPAVATWSLDPSLDADGHCVGAPTVTAAYQPYAGP